MGLDGITTMQRVHEILEKEFDLTKVKKLAVKSLRKACCGLQTPVIRIPMGQHLHCMELGFVLC